MKYRVWNKVLKEWWTEFFMLNSNGDLFMVEQYDAPSRAEQDDYIIQYSTGLYDKCGKEVYEGDIFIEPTLDKHEVGWCDVLGEWMTYTYCSHEKLSDYCFSEEFFNDSDAEVIGNILENPLLRL